jgi:hypothetical protein
MIASHDISRSMAEITGSTARSRPGSRSSSAQPPPWLERPAEMAAAQALRGSRRRKLTYNLRLIRAAYSHSIEEIADLFSLHPNAIRQWLKAGLGTIDNRRPYYIHGTQLIAFLSARQRGRKQCCAVDEMFCFRCRAPRRPLRREVIVETLNSRQTLVRGACELCGTKMYRSCSTAKAPDLHQVFTVMGSARLCETDEPFVKCELDQGE